MVPGAPCDPGATADTIRDVVATTCVPALWHDVGNDQYIAPDVMQIRFDAFQAGAGRVTSSQSRHSVAMARCVRSSARDTDRVAVFQAVRRSGGRGLPPPDAAAH